MKRLRRWAVRIGVALAAIVVLVPIAFRATACARETERAADVAPPEGAYVRAAELAIYRQEMGPSDGPPVVLVHGTLAWSGTFRPLMERLAARGYHAVAIDLPPFGYSQRPAGHDYGRAAQAVRIGAVIDAMHLGSVVLVGHSFGGGATVEAAMTLGDRVRGLVLLDAALALGQPPSAPPLPYALDATRNAFVASTLTNPAMIAPGLRAFVFDDDAIVTPERVAIYARPYATTGTTDAVGHWVVTGLYGDESGSRSAAEASYRALALPTLLVWGREDTITPLAQGEHVAALVPASRLVVLDRVGHIPHVEALESTAAALLDFLDDVQGQTHERDE
jgi:2-hydroxymuconate-semialdehyde hydrolase